MITAPPPAAAAIRLARVRKNILASKLQKQVCIDLVNLASDKRDCCKKQITQQIFNMSRKSNRRSHEENKIGVK